MAMTCLFGSTSRAAMAEGSPAPIVAKRVVQQHGIGLVGAVVEGEPDLIDAVVEAYNAVVAT